MRPGSWGDGLRRRKRQRSERLAFCQLLVRARLQRVVEQQSQRLLQNLGDQFAMRRADRPLRSVVSIDSCQTPMLVRAIAIMQSTNIRKPSQQTTDRPQSIRFKIFESGF
jgi:hypothetical protein